MTRPEDDDPILVEVVRSGFVESVHHGRVVVTGPDGAVLSSVGAEFAPMYPRSSSKPLQAVGMLRAGLDLDGALLALVAASHSGESFHVDGVRQILAGAGLDERALQTPPDWPLDEAAREAAIRAGVPRSPVFMNCSGKHAGMLATTVALGADVATYRDPDHPTQLAVLRTIDDLAGEQATNLAVDGCGAPLFALTLYGLARAFGRLAAAADGPERRVADAVRAHPEFTSGTTRDELALHRAVPGLLGKAGAEAVYAVGLPDGRGVALKISDGGPRARAVLMAAVLQRLGFDHPTLDAQVSEPVLGHGERVGEVRPVREALGALGG
ncbi:L-asparaginase II [Friedmanniella luteola]|uniref:L-asparaginase II n=1 Tax=Friedmanniella luteola TaxID=546871 RepID=A0A1H1LW37_9ACTN|nr:asparaginase [Friedmanniella luteola]SDR78858.1 L-asparaginase II [Friedmanniella luteola]